jgi:hypothetical protein
MHGIGNPAIVYPCLDHAAQWTIADQQQVCPGVHGSCAGEGIDEIDVPFDSEQIRDAADQQCVGGKSKIRAYTLTRQRVARLEAQGIHAIGDTQHASARCAFCHGDGVEDGRGRSDDAIETPIQESRRQP